jgi:hypothetical protein
MWNEWLKTWNLGCTLVGGSPPGLTPLWYYFYFAGGVILDSAWLTIPILFVVKGKRLVNRSSQPVQSRA